MHTHFKHLHMRRYLLAFGSLFDQMTITRENEDGKEEFRQEVPLEYGPKERWLVHLTQDPDYTKGVGQVVPRMSYEMTSLDYDTTRKLNTLDKLKFNSNQAHKLAKLYIGVPYVMKIQLSILVKLQQDGMQIVEQILPFFTPDYTIAVRPLEGYPDLVDQVPIVLQSVSHSDNYEDDFMKRRVIIWTLDFAMKVFFYGPIKDTKRIEEVIVNLYNSPYEDLSAPTADALPKVTIDVQADPPTQNVSPNTTTITSNTTITEYLTADGASASPSASSSRSLSPSASMSPSRSVSASRSPSASASASVSPSPSASPSPAAP
jgi:hypothetical protein